MFRSLLLTLLLAGLPALALADGSGHGHGMEAMASAAEVPHGAAAANSGRTALLVAALGGATAQLHRATEDFLHQEFRSPAMPDSLALVHALRADGHAAVVSGAGPTVLVLTADGPGDLPGRCPAGWAAYPLEVDDAGVRTLTS